MESPYEPEEGLLDEILGQGSIASQQVGEPEPGWGRTLVHVGQAGLARQASDPLSAAIVVFFCPHITWTNEDPKVLQVPGITARRISLKTTGHWNTSTIRHQRSGGHPKFAALEPPLPKR